jgi:hypothetical protein
MVRTLLPDPLRGSMRVWSALKSWGQFNSRIFLFKHEPAGVMRLVLVPLEVWRFGIGLKRESDRSNYLVAGHELLIELIGHRPLAGAPPPSNAERHR